MKNNAENYEGKLILDKSGFVVLKSTEKDYYPLPYAVYVALPVEVMKMEAIHFYRDYLNKTVTIAGFLQDDLLFDARIVRTYVPKPKILEKVKDYWNNRVPKADIRWTARKLPGYTIQFEVDVRQMITINDSYISKDLKSNGLMVNDPSNCNDDIYRIYRYTRIKESNPYIYEYDNETFGCEFFMYPYELRVLKIGDCDDWGIELASYLISAGVPEWRVRCVVGLTYSGGGHLTVYVLSDDLTTWYHINSTTSWMYVENQKWAKLSDFPKANDPNDDIGIKDVWFSFNNKYAWHAFETHGSVDNTRKTPWMKHFKIIPKFD